MLRVKSLTAKFIFIGIILFAFFAVYVAAGYIFTHHLSGEAKRINLAGRQRMLTISMSYQIMSLLRLPPSAEREVFIKNAESRMAEYEEVLYGLRDGSGKLGLKPMPEHYQEPLSQLNTLIELWSKTRKPVLLDILKLHPERKNEACGICHSAIRDNLLKVEAFVNSIEKRHYDEIKSYDDFRFFALGFFIFAAAFIVLYVRQGIISPVQKLQNATKEMKEGRLNVKVDVKSRDEIGRLSESFNEMSQSLSESHADLKSYSEELFELNQASNSIIGITTTENLYKSICENARKLFNIKMVWLGLVTEEGFEVRPVAQAGFEDGYLSSIKATWDDSPTGMGPAGMSIKTRRPYMLNADDPRFGPWRQEAKMRGYASILGVPLICSREKCVATLLFYSDRPDLFTPDKIRLAHIFTNQAATAIENARLVEGLEEKVEERTRQLEDANYELNAVNTELEMRKQEAEEAKAQAESANSAKSDFLANMSHELRTPLNAILGFSEVIRDGLAGPVNDKQREFLNDIYGSGSHLLDLINDILDLSKVEAGKMELELSEFNLEQLIDGSLVMFREKAMKHNIKVKAEVVEGVGDIRADERKIKQVMFNLLSNAMKFTPDGGSVQVTARKVNSEQYLVNSKKLFTDDYSLTTDRDFVEISVTDTGIGISPEDQKRLFQPFQQLETSYTKKYEGTGLGLNLCKKFVELHGGRIWVESKPGKGSRFVFLIPVVQ